MGRSPMQGTLSEPQLWLFLCLPFISENNNNNKSSYCFLKTYRCAWHCVC